LAGCRGGGTNASAIADPHSQPCCEAGLFSCHIPRKSIDVGFSPESCRLFSTQPLPAFRRSFFYGVTWHRRDFDKPRIGTPDRVSNGCAPQKPSLFFVLGIYSIGSATTSRTGSTSVCWRATTAISKSMPKTRRVSASILRPPKYAPIGMAAQKLLYVWRQ
jgi:hypothetical protein